MSEDFTTGEKVVRILVKSGIAGLIGGITVRVVFGDVKGRVAMPLFGKSTVPIAIGGTIALGKATAEIVDEFFLDDETRDQLDKAMIGLFGLALSVGATLLIGWMLLPSSMMNMNGFLKLAGIGAVSIIASDWSYTTFLEGVIDDFGMGGEEEIPEE
jgi:ribosomal protein S28E/S33